MPWSFSFVVGCLGWTSAAVALDLGPGWAHADLGFGASGGSGHLLCRPPVVAVEESVRVLLPALQEEDRKG